ncbi:MAG: hypothetical protein SFV17_20405 [Candidatus Obscuribacter sp.]|nr:hypothetical protein [Candidatus Melainabacteria bacterium]MBK8220744.1 hypothetical protein [Candidatus Obscuribacter sp.]MBK9279334.1 hypothetical protein [Candidatus Obscuribacter sp.]MBL8083091.1 hypothetical protein [Candidatus Obscuribacter sp.]MDX1989059.1 hypothetical protein [Candidatus Obscuribacter sp.]
MAHAREPITTIISLVGVALTCFVIAKASWWMLLVAIVVVCFGCCLYKLIDKKDKPGRLVRERV